MAIHSYIDFNRNQMIWSTFNILNPMIEWSKSRWHLTRTSTCTWFRSYWVYGSLLDYIPQIFFRRIKFCLDLWIELTRIWFNGQFFNWIKFVCVDGSIGLVVFVIRMFRKYRTELLLYLLLHNLSLLSYFFSLFISSPLSFSLSPFYFCCIIIVVRLFLCL